LAERSFSLSCGTVKAERSSSLSITQQARRAGSTKGECQPLTLVATSESRSVRMAHSLATSSRQTVGNERRTGDHVSSTFSMPVKADGQIYPVPRWPIWWLGCRSCERGRGHQRRADEGGGVGQREEGTQQRARPRRERARERRVPVGLGLGYFGLRAGCMLGGEELATRCCYCCWLVAKR
jgi:hypothetical protein